MLGSGEHTHGVAEHVDGSPMGFRAPQVCAAVGISYRQLDYWARTGLIRPSIQGAQGSGSQRLYSF
ncbi:MAG: MerR family transcriptional regulator, partial [Acidimicrobiia bacterium]